MRGDGGKEKKRFRCNAPGTLFQRPPQQLSRKPTSDTERYAFSGNWKWSTFFRHQILSARGSAWILLLPQVGVGDGVFVRKEKIRKGGRRLLLFSPGKSRLEEVKMVLSPLQWTSYFRPFELLKQEINVSALIWEKRSIGPLLKTEFNNLQPYCWNKKRADQYCSSTKSNIILVSNYISYIAVESEPISPNRKSTVVEHAYMILYLEPKIKI